MRSSLARQSSRGAKQIVLQPYVQPTKQGFSIVLGQSHKQRARGRIRNGNAQHPRHAARHIRVSRDDEKRGKINQQHGEKRYGSVGMQRKRCQQKPIRLHNHRAHGNPLDKSHHIQPRAVGKPTHIQRHPFLSRQLDKLGVPHKGSHQQDREKGQIQHKIGHASACGVFPSAVQKIRGTCHDGHGQAHGIRLRQRSAVSKKSQNQQRHVRQKADHRRKGVFFRTANQNSAKKGIKDQQRQHRQRLRMKQVRDHLIYSADHQQTSAAALLAAKGGQQQREGQKQKQECGGCQQHGSPPFPYHGYIIPYFEWFCKIFAVEKWKSRGFHFIFFS